ncbi:hypothetical protein KDK95_17960 [Actinospica sp. MGRD01-02]|uniref:Uncharacterized protein n=1 Tax=Actinospica acidithermotolerans TaxID=2828514 RepID=A0A941EFM5_9ACTN|nr:prolipoprotein diacylglyceryl transferase family protein [Actinospica acidithermotolerans]MBR7828204.1 hypothetical protein [Actinospica acidithermotolerans]
MLHTEIPSPGVNGVHLGPRLIHACAIAYIVGIALAVLLHRCRAATGGDPAPVEEMAIWGVPAGLIGGRSRPATPTIAQMR